MKKSILITAILLLTRQHLFCETVSKPVQSKTDSCFNRAELQVINGVFIDLDDCELRDSINTAIIQKQDSIINSKVDIIDGFKKLTIKQDVLTKQLSQFIQFQADLSEQQKKENDKLRKQMIVQGIKIAVPIGVLTGVGLILGLLNVFKIY